MNKFHAVSCRCLNKEHAFHHSRLEASYCDILLAQKQDKEIHDYGTQYKIELYVKGIKICNHFVDFVIYGPGQEVKEFHEVKGVVQEVWRIKHLLTTVLFPKIPYVVKYKGDITWKQNKMIQHASNRWKLTVLAKTPKRSKNGRRNHRSMNEWLRSKRASISVNGR